MDSFPSFDFRFQQRIPDDFRSAVPPLSPASTHEPLSIRAALPSEEFRARALFASEDTKPPANAEFLLALRKHPVERIVGTLAMWKCEDDLEFLLARLPGVDAGEIATGLLPGADRLAPDFREICYGRLLSPQDEWSPFLENAGYARTRTERVFEADVPAASDRIRRLYRRYADSFPKTWRIEPIARHRPETVWPLISAYRLITADDLQLLWHLPTPRGYHHDWSPILFDENGPLGVVLVRFNGRCVAFDIRVVKPIPAKSRALANIALIEFIIDQSESSLPRTVAFRGDESVHRETANLAFRLGGHEVGRRHRYVKQGGRASLR